MRMRQRDGGGAAARLHQQLHGNQRASLQEADGMQGCRWISLREFDELISDKTKIT